MNEDSDLQLSQLGDLLSDLESEEGKQIVKPEAAPPKQQNNFKPEFQALTPYQRYLEIQKQRLAQ